jgi:hypothetical protein
MVRRRTWFDHFGQALFAAASCWLICGSPAAAQPAPFTEESVRSVVNNVMNDFDKLRCGTRGFCAPVTAAERTNPPVSVEVAGTVLARGMISGLGKFCKLDWMSRNHRPMMTSFRRQGMNERQMALIGALHGVGMGWAEGRTLGSSCADQNRDNIDRQIDFKG